MHILKLPGNSHRDLRQLLWHRHRIVQMPGDERRPATEEEAVEQARTSAAGKASVSSLGLPAPQGSARAAGPDESSDRRVGVGRNVLRNILSVFEVQE